MAAASRRRCFVKSTTAVIVLYIMSSHPLHSLIYSTFARNPSPMRSLGQSLDINLTNLEDVRWKEPQSLTTTNQHVRDGLGWLHPRRQVHTVDCAARMNLTRTSSTETYTEQRHEGRYRDPPARQLTSDEDVLNVTSDCHSFLSNYQYVLQPLSRDEEDFPLAFLLLVHTAAPQVERLLRALYRPHNVYCIHMDLKSPPTFQLAMRSLVNCFPNVFISSKLQRVAWGESSQVEANLACMRELDAGKTPWKYLFNVAGQEYPLRTLAEMVRILKLYYPYNEITNTMDGKSLEKIVYERTNYNMSNQRGNKREAPPHNIKLFKGSAYGIFSRQFIHYMLNNRKSLDFWSWLKPGIATDELYWNSLNMNPHLHAPGGRHSKPQGPAVVRTAVWTDRLNNACHGRVVRGVCVFGLDDLPWLVKQQGFIANKFYTGVAGRELATTYDCMEEWYWNRTAVEYRNLTDRIYQYPTLNMEVYKKLRSRWSKIYI